MTRTARKYRTHGNGNIRAFLTFIFFAGVVLYVL